MTSTETHAALSREPFFRSVGAARRAEAARYLAGVLALALAYVAVAKGAQALHYTASVDCDVQTYRAGAVEPTPVAAAR